MTSKNEHTGDKLQTKPASEDYRNNYDRIFKKKCEHKWKHIDSERHALFQCELCGIIERDE